MELDAMIQAEGYVGQEQARQAICVSAYRHVKRLKAIHLDGKDPNTLPKRDCLLFIGETGCGKTHLCEIVFDRILKIPTVIWNSANLTEAGYVGGKLEHLLVKLFSVSGNNTLISQTGVLVLDEIDKVASTNGGVLPGERINRDINGESVQKLLLKLLEGGQLSVPNVGSGNQAWDFNARDTLVVGCGAFSALRNLKYTPSMIGFGASGKSQIQGTVGIEELVRYGLTEEFIGRFGNIVNFRHLKRTDLLEILKRTITTKYSNEFNEIAVEFSVTPEVLDLLVDRAQILKTGARGLTNGLSEAMQDVFYEVYSVDGVKSLRLVKNGDQIGYELIRKASKRPTKIPSEAPSHLAHSFSNVVSAI
jgi:ATP-dependent Clp protease ATP-binding subunit ClpX